MNNLCIFDLDGVLIDSKELHYEALNLALQSINSNYVISKNEQASIYEGMTTKSKLEILTSTKGLPKELHQYIWQLKQEYSSIMFQNLSQDSELIEIFKYIKSKNILLAVASNSIRKTLDTCLTALGIADYVDLSLSNEDVKNPKPNPEIYTVCMASLSAKPDTTIIFEDSIIGRQAAISSGAILIEINSRKDLSIDLIIERTNKYFG